jgi:hypothetical protein
MESRVVRDSGRYTSVQQEEAVRYVVLVLKEINITSKYNEEYSNA